jgi:CRISPR-associated exonuclease Cas4
VDLVPVVELRQWTYCPRVVYYHLLMTGAGRSTYKMEEGLRAQELIENLEMRRTLREYGFSDAERQFGIWLEDEKLGLSGKVDLLLKGEETAAIVDFKLTSGEVGENHRMQLAGYALLVESSLRLRVPVAFLYRIPDNGIFPVAIDDPLRTRVRRAIEAI